MSICLNDYLLPNEQSQEMFTAHSHIIRMLTRRGYTVQPEPWHTDYTEFLQVWTTRAAYSAFTIVGHSANDVVICFFPFEEKLRINSIRTILECCEDNGYNHTMIIYSGTITSFANQQLKKIRSQKKFWIETFNIRRFQYDVFAHQYVPTQTVLTDAEAAVLLEKYKITSDKLPKIYHTDPIAQYYGLRPKQILKVICPSPEGYFYPLWRVCVKGNINK